MHRSTHNTSYSSQLLFAGYARGLFRDAHMARTATPGPNATVLVVHMYRSAARASTGVYVWAPYL